MPKQNHIYDTSLTDEYVAAVNRMADVVHDFRTYKEDEGFKNEKPTVVFVEDILKASSKSGNEEQQDPIAFVIANVLTPAECDALIEEAEDFGIEDHPSYTARTAKRTKEYTNKSLSDKVEERIKDLMDSKFHRNHREKENNNESNLDPNKCKPGYTKNPYMGHFYGIHSNWRILRYDAGDGSAFPAHFDQMDSLQIQRDDGSGRKDLCVSSHTLLVQLSDATLQGGATRFYPRAKANRSAKDNDHTFRREQFDHSVDVILPKGWAIAFRQRGLLHAGQPVLASSPVSKYVAQAGILRFLPEGTLVRPSVFKNGPGVTKGAF